VGDQEPGRGGLTRREIIKRGAIVGGTVMWVTPAVQVIGMRPAQAQEVSPRADCTVILTVGEDTFCFTVSEEACDCFSACVDGGDDPFTCLARCGGAITPVPCG
jgi:hypothetical protein